MFARQKRVIHFHVIDEATAIREACYQPDVFSPERHTEVVDAIVPGRIDHELLPIDAPGVVNWMSRDQPVDCVAFRVCKPAGRPQRQTYGILEAPAGLAHPNTARQLAHVESAAMLQDEAGLGGLAFGCFVTLGAGFEEKAGGPGNCVATVAHPVECALHAAPVRDGRWRITIVGILCEMGGLVAGFDLVSTEEAWLADLRMPNAKRPGFAEAQSPEIAARFDIGRIIPSAASEAHFPAWQIEDPGPAWTASPSRVMGVLVAGCAG